MHAILSPDFRRHPHVAVVAAADRHSLISLQEDDQTSTRVLFSPCHDNEQQEGEQGITRRTKLKGIFSVHASLPV